MAGYTMVAGAPDAALNGDQDQGAIYVFEEPAGGWTNSAQTAKLTTESVTFVNLLGHSVSISGNAIAAGGDGLGYA